MRKPLKSPVFLVILFCYCFVAQAQTLVTKQTIYFEPGRVTVQNGKLLSDLRDSIKDFQLFTVEIQGNADSSGKYELNKILAEKRANAVRDLLMEAGIPSNIISIKAFGPDNPVTSNKTRSGRDLNRRVDILLWQSQPPVTEVHEEVLPDINELYKKPSVPFQTFCIDNTRDTSIRCRYGTVIHIKANSVRPTPGSGNTCVTYNVKEVFLRSDMILENLTTTSNGELIESQGMIYVEAIDSRGTKLDLQKGKDLVILVPTDSINPKAKIFDGERGHDEVMNWTLNNNAVLSDFKLDEINYCSGWICGEPEIIVGEPCSFFFCRVGRVGRAIKGIFNRDARQENREFRQQLSNRRFLQDTTIKFVSTNPLTISRRPRIKDESLVPICGQLEELFKKYGVKDFDGLMRAVNKQLLDSFKVSTMEQLRDTLDKIKLKKMELAYQDRTLAYEDFRYYVYNSSRFGWSNVDCFSEYPASQLTTVIIDLKAGPNTDCKLVFKDQRSVVSATKEAGTYQFKGVPRGQKAWIVAIRYENGKPLMAMKEITIERRRHDIELQELTLEELKARVKMLDL